MLRPPVLWLLSSSCDLCMQYGECALHLAVREGHLDMLKLLLQLYQDSNMGKAVSQYHMDLAGDHHHEHVVDYLSSEFPNLKRKVREHYLHSTNSLSQVSGHAISILFATCVAS